MAESQPLPSAAAKPSKIVAPAAALSQKSTKGATTQLDSRAASRRTSNGTPEASPGASQLKQNKSTDRVTEARNCLLRAKSHLSESRNLRADLKAGITQSVERLYQLIKEEAAAAAQIKGDGPVGEDAVKATPPQETPKTLPEVNSLLLSLAEHSALVKESSEKMERLKQAMERQGEKLEKTATYASVAAGPSKRQTPERTTLHSIVVTSKNEGDSGEEVLNKIREAINAKDGGIEIEKVRKAKDRKVVMACRSVEERKRVRERLERAGDHLVVEDMRNKDPLLVFRGVLRIHSDEDLLGALRSQNRDVFRDLGNGDDRLAVRYKKNSRNPHTNNVVVSTSPTVWNRMLVKGKVRIDLQTVFVEDQSPLVQCTRCLGYGHSRRLCKEPADLCSHCGGPHLRAECHQWLEAVTPKCPNCVKAKMGKTDHNAFDPECPVRVRWDRLARTSVAYC
ncbi:hypothetical protein PYW08_009731 [Mythimna loreyi]|uniref:Uncharacterized protein n=1 Tax=Mythimna loreyi TaxID=667449 RepID=A0ACC2Q798_9NEOP|nr:hypothetical protein PYW08_009731 [Mythimna loreyi]